MSKRCEPGAHNFLPTVGARFCVVCGAAEWPDDKTVAEWDITHAERVLTAAHCTLPSDGEIVAFRRGVFARRRGEPGALVDADRIYPDDMIRRIAWRTGWAVMDAIRRGD